MTNVELNDLLSDGDNETLNEVKERFLSIDQLVKDIAKDNCMKTLLWPYSGQNLKSAQDIDINYAIGLLKKTDQNTNVYEHLRNVLDKILTEKPKNPLEMFEKYSLMLKRTYIFRKVNFERVFVDHISQRFCLKTLQMYKCARKKESVKRKGYRYDKKNDRDNKKSETSEAERNKIPNIAAGNGDDVNARVQNLWEVNFMFEKAGCGLPIDEVSLLSFSMNTMAKLNKFKSIRFWGKIFGLKKMYFVIECEWLDAELLRKLSMEENRRHSKSSTSAGTAPDKTIRDVSTDSVLSPSELFESTIDYKTESFESVTRTTVDGETTGDFMHFDGDSSSSGSSDGNDTAVLCESSAAVFPAESYGIGANRNVYFVTNDLNAKWIELDSVSPRSIVEARNTKRYFTGKLYDPVNASFAKFGGLEIDYLRAQIARISSSTQICPQGYCVINKKYITQNEISDFQSTSSDASSRKFYFDFISNENVKPISNTNLIDCKHWAHKNPRIENNGISDYSDLPAQSSMNLQESEEIVLIQEEEYEYNNFSHNKSKLNVDEELFGNLRHDVTDDDTPAWTGALCSPFHRRSSYYITMKSNVWPGAYAVAYKDKTDFVYIGWAQKQDFSGLYLTLALNLLNELQVDNITKENFVEYPDPTENQKANIKRKSHKNTKTSL